MFACRANWPAEIGGTVRVSFHPTAEEALARAERSLGVVAVEELGVGIIWRRDEDAAAMAFVEGYERAYPQLVK